MCPILEGTLFATHQTKSCAVCMQAEIYIQMNWTFAASIKREEQLLNNIIESSNQSFILQFAFSIQCLACVYIYCVYFLFAFPILGRIESNTYLWTLTCCSMTKKWLVVFDFLSRMLAAALIKLITFRLKLEFFLVKLARVFKALSHLRPAADPRVQQELT